MASRSADAEHRDEEGRLRPGDLILLTALLVSPGLALHRLSAFVDFRWLAAYGIVISLALSAMGTMGAIPVFWQLPGRFLSGTAIVVIRKDRATSKHYPRRTGVAAKRPL